MSSHDPQADRHHVRSLLKPGMAHRLNLADDAQHRFLQDHFAGIGQTPQTSPQLFRALERTREAHVQNGGPQPAPTNNDNQPLAIITGLDTTDHRHYIASGLSVFPNGCYYTDLSLQLFDAETGNAIGQQAQQIVYGNGQYVPIQATGDTEIGRAVRAELVCSHVPPGEIEPEEVIESTVESVTVVLLPKTPPKSTAPVPKPGHNTGYTLICLRRHAGNEADCDYGPFGTQIVKVPVKGSITYNAAIVPLTTDNASAQLYIISRNSGNNTKYFLPGQPITTNFSIDPNDQTKLIWNFDLADFGVADPFANFSFVDISLSFAVTTQESIDLISAFVTSAVDSTPGPNLEKILPLQFADGCIAEGTLITLADGSTRPIEQFEGGETILSGDGSPLTVRFTNDGVELDLMVEIKDAYDRVLKVTSKHPVLTNNGPTRAHMLQAGDSLISATGAAKIAQIKHVAFAGRVWNLTLGVGDELNRLTDDNRTFYANGILVGDSAMQAIHNQEHRQKPENVLTSLPERWHQDYLNSLNRP